MEESRISVDVTPWLDPLSNQYAYFPNLYTDRKIFTEQSRPQLDFTIDSKNLRRDSTSNGSGFAETRPFGSVARLKRALARTRYFEAEHTEDFHLHSRLRTDLPASCDESSQQRWWNEMTSPSLTMYAWFSSYRDHHRKLKDTSSSTDLLTNWLKRGRTTDTSTVELQKLLLQLLIPITTTTSAAVYTFWSERREWWFLNQFSDPFSPPWSTAFRTVDLSEWFMGANLLAKSRNRNKENTGENLTEIPLGSTHSKDDKKLAKAEILF